MKKLVLLALISTSAFSATGLNRQTCTTDTKPSVTDPKTNVTTTTSVTVCQTKNFTEAEVADALKKLKEAQPKVKEPVEDLTLAKDKADAKVVTP